MVRQYYVDQVTRLSEEELQTVFQTVTPPVCLLGGWAVHLHVNPEFRSTTGPEYIGSRDVDLGVHVQADWTAEELQENPVGTSLTELRELGYERSRFGFVQYFHRDTGERLTEEAANARPIHEVFELYVDVIPDTTELGSFEDAFGFRPPAEPLLEPVFEDDAGHPLSDSVDWSVPTSVLLPAPELLAAMKIRSLPDRDEGHKQVKDVADLHALLWYVHSYTQIRSDTLEHVSSDDLDQLEAALRERLFEDAASLLQIDTGLVRDSITRLLR